MESSPLTLAYDHARAASVATQSSDTTVAINEHTLAAGEFAKAATGTDSVEALRVLRLLEQHHQRLSELLRYPSENPLTTATDPDLRSVGEKTLSTSAAVAELRTSKSDLGLRSSSPLRAPPVLQHPRRVPPRDLSSSIASNLASARGIRANYTRQPLSPSVSTHQAPGNLEALPRRDSRDRNHSKISRISEHPRPTWVPLSANTPKPENSGRLRSAGQPTGGDEGFSRFYNTFENILSKISAPLAFAGLPLPGEENSASPVTSGPLKKHTQSREQADSDEPDLTKFFSRAALRASTRNDHSVNDSFYVVPTAGHTVSYAHILSFDQKEKRRMAASIHPENPELLADLNEEEDFVDARETPMPPTPQLSRESSRKTASRDRDVKLEELSTENASLKVCIDKLSKRLHTFEMSAQQNSMALVESMRMMRDFSPARQDPGLLGTRGSVGEEEALKKRILELEENVNSSVQDIKRLGKENEKLRSVVTRYRERWEKLKEGAKTRRDGAASGRDSPAPLKAPDVGSGTLGAG